MKRVSFAIIALLLLHLTAFSGVVDSDHARQVGSHFYHQATGRAVEFTLTYQHLNTGPSNGTAIGEPLYYIYNADGGHGFVIVSADDLAMPILAYSAVGRFDMTIAPPPVIGWLARYAARIAYAKSTHISPSASVTSLWDSYYYDKPFKQLNASAGPFLTSIWAQVQYYNDLCPVDASSPSECAGHVPTGCGATAMSQIMRFWHYPAHGVGAHSYTSAYGSLSANLAATSYDWANMPDSLIAPNSDVAAINYDIGVAVEMDYGTSGSGCDFLAGTVNCMTAFKNYFGYNTYSLRGLQRSAYPVESSWTALIKNELDNGRPLIYRGQGPYAAHFWVIDGYDATSHYHMNWGWGGVDNGYYSIDALHPASGTLGSLDSAEEMIIGIKPASPGVGISELGNTPSASALEIYPNPAINNITVIPADQDGIYALSVIDALGRQLRQNTGNLTAQKLVVDISGFPSGLYTIQFSSQSGLQTTRFVVR